MIKYDIINLTEGAIVLKRFGVVLHAGEAILEQDLDTAGKRKEVMIFHSKKMLSVTPCNTKNKSAKKSKPIKRLFQLNSKKDEIDEITDVEEIIEPKQPQLEDLCDMLIENFSLPIPEFITDWTLLTYDQIKYKVSEAAIDANTNDRLIEDWKLSPEQEESKFLKNLSLKKYNTLSHKEIKQIFDSLYQHNQLYRRIKSKITEDGDNRLWSNETTFIRKRTQDGLDC
jgi:uncharacterized membrane protein YheB (UPF0754 family)